MTLLKPQVNPKSVVLTEDTLETIFATNHVGTEKYCKLSKNLPEIFWRGGGLLPRPSCVNHYAEHIQVQNQHLVLEKKS